MQRILSIYDVSPFIHAGHVNKRARLERLVRRDIPGSDYAWETQYTPAGGTSFLLKAAIEGTQRGDVVFCCDRRPTIKQDMLSTYKSNRSHPDSIENDKRLAEFVLEHCGATVVARAGYEADDIVTTIVKSLHDQYDSIHIYTGDSDLYFLVDDVVSIKPSSSRAKEVTLENFSRAFKKGVTIPYNFAIPYKMLHGDSSDCIPPMPAHYRQKFEEITLIESFTGKLGDRDTLYWLVREAFPEALLTLDLIYPLWVDDVPLEFAKPDTQMMINWADTMHCGAYAGMASADFPAEKLVEEVQLLGIYEEV